MRDASAFLGAWPFSGATAPTVRDLFAEYQAAGIDGAALSPVEAVLQPEPMAANRRLFAALAAGVTSPVTACAVPILNPSLLAWEEHLAACLREGGALVRAVKIVPTYQDYTLDPPDVDALALACVERRLGLCVQVRMEDERMHHPRMKVPPVPPSAVVALAQRFPRLPILVCGSYMAELAVYRNCPNVGVELSMVESGYLLRTALRHLSADRLFLGTHAPIHMLSSAVAKLASDELEAEAHAQMSHRNFDRFFSAS